MVFILADSSLDHALETLTLEENTRYNDKVCSFPGLSQNKNTKNERKIVPNLLSKDLKEKTNIVMRHDVLNNSIFLIDNDRPNVREGSKASPQPFKYRNRVEKVPEIYHRCREQF